MKLHYLFRTTPYIMVITGKASPRPRGPGRGSAPKNCNYCATESGSLAAAAAVSGEHPAHAGQDVVYFKGFVDESVCAELFGLPAQRVGGVPGRDDDL